MSTLFLDMVNRSIFAGWIVLVVLLLRLIFKKAPKWLHVLLWGMVAIHCCGWHITCCAGILSWPAMKRSFGNLTLHSSRYLEELKSECEQKAQEYLNYANSDMVPISMELPEAMTVPDVMTSFVID